MKNTTRIGIVLCISIAFFLAEIIIGFRTKSLALIADAFHYLNDIVAYAIAYIAAHLHEKGKHNVNFTFAFHRAELVGAFFNGVFLLALALSIFLQSIERFVNVEAIEHPVMVLIIGSIGLFLNIISAIVVHDHGGHGHGSDSMALAIADDSDVSPLRDNIHAQHNHTLDPPVQVPQHNLNLIGVLVHLFGDAINNIAVIISAIIIWKVQSPQRFYADPAVSLAISLIIFGSAIPMTLKSGRLLLEAAPSYLDLEKVKDDLLSVPEVVSLHDLHVWHLSQSVILASLHVCVPLGTTLEQWEKTEKNLQHCFAAYGVSHVTISPELVRDRDSEVYTPSIEEGGCSSRDEFGCAVDGLKKRKPGV
ncbi:CDF zinc transporter [Collybia nuda]|uniref:CDF zinc transporter n=1 Tax=Collybia nuda TaxID=64659 RepID=A0A9P5YCE5_9AGAR|nr:CDF zinc transporter [Collybia nuda]